MKRCACCHRQHSREGPYCWLCSDDNCTGECPTVPSPLNRIDHAGDMRIRIRGAREMHKAHPELPSTTEAYHLCHNWGNEAARAIMARYEALSSAYGARKRRLSAEENHLEHIAKGFVGRFLWCVPCQAATA